MSQSFRLEWAAATDAGRVRGINQDAALAEGDLFAVADGMGGHAAGEIASQVAVDALRGSVATEGLVEAVRIANRAVLARADEDPSLRGMGTTLCAIALVEDETEGPVVQFVNVGDSRAYLFRDSELQQITEDHNLVAQLEREGRLTPEEARVHPQRNIITRVLGNDPDVEVDLFSVEPFRGDRYVLCSDGLFGELDDEEIAGVLRAERDPQRATNELVRRANDRGGRDNVTVVVVDVVDDGDRSRQASAALADAPATTAAPPPAPAVVPDAEDHTPSGGGAPAPRAERTRRRRLTWRSALFTVALLVVAAVVVGSIWWFGRNTFYVGVDDGEVTIFRGRPGGVLWLDPTVEQRTGLDLDDVPASRRDDIVDGKEQSSLERARRYVANLKQQAAEEERRRTPPTTSTTVPPFFPPSTTVAPPP